MALTQHDSADRYSAASGKEQPGRCHDGVSRRPDCCVLRYSCECLPVSRSMLRSFLERKARRRRATGTAMLCWRSPVIRGEPCLQLARCRKTAPSSSGLTKATPALQQTCGRNNIQLCYLSKLLRSDKPIGTPDQLMRRYKRFTLSC